MLMDGCYLLQQHLHLLTATGEGGGGQEVRGQTTQSGGVGADQNLGTFCR